MPDSVDPLAPTMSFAGGAPAPTGENSAKPGDRIGPYDIINKIGQGGMGQVYLAVRADKAFHKRVALKILKRGMDSEQILARFQYERQILASLDHPNIARILDGGATPDGLPYFVMEFIEGQPIDEYVNARNLSIAERLKLFRTVCDAVQYAHRNLVVHRDLKPSNILVTTGGTVKLLDFGIAKVLNRNLFPGDVIATQAWERPMTPAYASPEQVRGSATTTSSDVYSLGVVLYELLTGQRPYELRGVAAGELERVVASAEPEKPSTAARRISSANDTGQRTGGRTRRVDRELEGDLDNIVLMALRKEPERRYASADQFSEDIRRYLDGLPVLAREDSWKYRAAKFIGRHKTAVSAATAVAVLLIALVAVLGIASQRIARERDIAQAERDKAERVSTFLADLFRVNEPGEAQGNQVTARELLDRGASDVAVSLEGNPDIQASMMQVIGRAYQSLGLFERALPMFERALETRRRKLGDSHPDTATSLINLADLAIERGDYQKGEALAREGLAIRRKLLPPKDALIGEALNIAGYALYMQRKHAEAEAVYREALDITRTSAPGSDQLVSVLGNQGLLLSDLGRPDGAESLLREAADLTRKLHGNRHPATVTALNNVATVVLRRGDVGSAETAFRELVQAATELFGAEHPSLGLYHTNLGYVLSRQKKYDEAEREMRTGLEIRRKLLTPENPAVGHSELLLGRLLAETGRFQEAEPLARDAHRLFTKNFAGGNTMTADAASVLGWILTEEKRYREAEPLLLASHQALQPAHSKSRLFKQNVERLIRLYSERGDRESEQKYQALLAVSQ